MSGRGLAICPFCGHSAPWGRHMADYKLYGLDGAGQIAGVPEVIEAPTDRQALAAARERKPRKTAELWHGTRLVGRIEA